MSIKPFFDWIEGPLHEMEPVSDTAKVTKNLRLDKSWVLSKTYFYVSPDT